MRRGWLFVSLLSRSGAHQHGELKASLPLVTRCLSTATSSVSTGHHLPATPGPAQPHHGPVLASADWQSAGAPSWRGFAAAADEEPARTPGPSPAKLRAVPFTVTRQDAVREFEAYHSSNWLFKQPSNGLEKVKEAYLPFYVTTASMRSELASAELGFQEWGTVFNPRTRRFERQLVVDWRPAIFDVVFERQYGSDLEGSQVYAAYKYPRQDVKAVRPGPAVAAARRFLPDMMEVGHDGSTRRVGPFEMLPGTAAGLSLEWYRRQELQSVSAWIKETTGAHDVRRVQLTMAPDELRTSPVYVPVYIFRSHHFGTKLHTFVSGCVPGAVSGPHTLDETYVGLLTAASVAVGLAITETWRHYSWQTLLWGWLALPAVAAGALTRLWPRLCLAWSAYTTEAERKKQQEGEGGGPWDAEFVQAYERERTQHERVYRAAGARAYEDAPPTQDPVSELFRRLFGLGGPTSQQGQQQQQRQQQARQQQQQQQQQRRRQQQQGQSPWEAPRRPASGDPRDPDGYYKALGVRPDATRDEIQAAFRGQAQRLHPDHVSDPAKKAEATKRFQALLEAYQVLRDPSKRQAYDRGY